VNASVSVASLKTRISDVLKAQSGAVPGSGLFGIANPETNVVKTVEDANGRSFGGLLVINHS